MSKRKRKGGHCANSVRPDMTMEKKLLDITLHETGMADNVDAPYTDMAEYKMVTGDDDTTVNMGGS